MDAADIFALGKAQSSSEIAPFQALPRKPRGSPATVLFRRSTGKKMGDL
jgi:hypothetical protein